MANISDDIKYIPEDIAETEPLTTVIGIKCSDGIVLASDSQITSNSMKTYEGSKIFPINDFVVLGASGLVGQMKLLSESLKQELDKELLTDLDLRMKLENTLLSLHSKFNLHWSKSLGQKTTIFNPVSILGAKLKDGSFKLYLLNFTQNGPWIDEIENYEAIGHGYLLASLVLKQQSRVPKSDNKIFADLSFG